MQLRLQFFYTNADKQTKWEHPKHAPRQLELKSSQLMRTSAAKREWMPNSTVNPITKFFDYYFVWLQFYLIFYATRDLHAKPVVSNYTFFEDHELIEEVP